MMIKFPGYTNVYSNKTTIQNQNFLICHEENNDKERNLLELTSKQTKNAEQNLSKSIGNNSIKNDDTIDHSHESWRLHH